jgi:hypothetical protein
MKQEYSSGVPHACRIIRRLMDIAKSLMLPPSISPVYGHPHASGVTEANAGCPELSFTGSAKPDRSLLTSSHARWVI